MQIPRNDFTSYTTQISQTTTLSVLHYFSNFVTACNVVFSCYLLFLVICYFLLNFEQLQLLGWRGSANGGDIIVDQRGDEIRILFG